MELVPNEFGGQWTRDKIDVFMKYAWAYLEIMKNQPFKLLYFDGFAGSGAIMQGGNEMDLVQSAATAILSLDHVKSFDLYYFVEKKKVFADSLNNMIKKDFALKTTAVANADCNEKLESMAKYLSRVENKKYRALALVDPYGMQVNWASLSQLKGLGIDMWILVPTGIGVARLLTNDGNIQDSWMNRLIAFLGMTKGEIMDAFYRTESALNLFNEIQTETKKEEKIVEKAASLYKKRLATIFKFVSDPLVMRNSNNSTMYHFLCCSNNAVSFKIANDIVKPKLK